MKKILLPSLLYSFDYCSQKNGGCIVSRLNTKKEKTGEGKVTFTMIVEGGGGGGVCVWM